MDIKNNFNSPFSAVDYWDEKPLILEGDLKLRVLQALYGAEIEFYRFDAGSKQMVETYITPVINELEEICNIKTRTIQPA